MVELRFVLLFVSFLSSVLSRSLEEFPKTTILDVPSLFQKTNDIFSFDPKLLEEQLQHEEELPKQNNSSFTLKLYPGEILLKSPFKNYRGLTLARMKRDSARVNNIFQKLNLASDVNQMDIQAPLISGLPEGVGGYFTKFGVGTPAKQLYTIIDTGSDVTWIQCAPCTKCYNQTDPLFDPSTSSSYKPLSCDSQLCNKLDKKGCIAKSCQYEVSYGDGRSFTKGDFATETLTFGKSVVSGIGIGCGHDNEGQFKASAGLLGLGGGSVSFPSQINASSFSYCLVDRFSASASTLEFGSSVPSDAITVPLLRNSRVPTFYFVALSGIQIGGRVFTFRAGGGIIVDSGTTVTQLPANVYIALRDEFVKGVKDLPMVGPYGSHDACFNVTSRTSVKFPAFVFLFGTKSLNLPAENYLRPVDTNVVCFAFAPSNGIAILGNIQQQGIRVGFDLERSIIGFSPKSC